MANLNLVTVSTGLQNILTNYLANNLVAKCYTNSATITEATVLADLTESTNYTDQTLTGGDWTVSYTGGKGQAVYDNTFTFTFTGSDTIRGIYITDSTETILISAKDFGFDLPVVSGSELTQNSYIISLDN